jgi:hypothetical protein
MSHNRNYDYHLQHTVARCGHYNIISGVSGDGVALLRCTKSRCKSWSCPTCRRRNIRRLAARLHQLPPGIRWRFLTLTIPCGPEPDKSTLIALRSAWRNFGRTLRRKYPRVHYVRVLDIGQGGNWHYHILISAYIPVSALRQLWSDFGGGWNVDIREVPDRMALHYILKYASHGYRMDPGVEAALYESGTRRYSFSAGLRFIVEKYKSMLLYFGQRNIPIDFALRYLIEWLTHIKCPWSAYSEIDTPLCYNPGPPG